MSNKQREGRLLFVLGAGASVPFGLPGAWSLRQTLKDSPPVLQPRSMRYFGLDAEFSKEFSNAFGCAHGQSIDTFLERNPKYLPYGKGAIAKTLAPLELKAIASKQLGSDWMAVLFQLFVDDPAAIVDGRVRFITFNYDNLLEVSIRQWIQQQGTKGSTASHYLQSLPIIHVYGQLKKLLGQHKYDIQYAKAILEQQDHYFSDEFLLSCGDDIHLIGDERDNSSSTLPLCKKWIQEAERIVFLGFGFDKTNVERIGATKIADTHDRVFATAVGLEAGERKKVMERLGSNIVLGDESVKCEQFLRRHCVHWLPSCWE